MDPKSFQYLFESIIPRTELQTRYNFFIAVVAPPLHQVLTRETCGRPRIVRNTLYLNYVGLRRLYYRTLVASTTWDSGHRRFAWDPRRPCYVKS